MNGIGPAKAMTSSEGGFMDPGFLQGDNQEKP